MPYVGDHIWNFNKLCWWAMVWWGAEKHKPEAKCFSLQSQCFRLEESERQRGNRTKNNFHSLSIAVNTINKTPDHFGEERFLFSGRKWGQDWFNLSQKPVSYVSLAEKDVEERSGKLLAWLWQRNTETVRQKERKIFPPPPLPMPKTWTKMVHI